MQQQGLLPDLVISSSATRALATARKLCKAMGRDVRTIRIDERLYEASARTLLEVLGACPPGARRILLVGHNPGLENLLMMLADTPVKMPADGKLLPTATLARLTIRADWGELSAGCARLESITRPSALPSKFPYPGPEGREKRRRPAYYYTQSSVIPYRLRRGKPEILLVSSWKKNHLVVPKGIQDPGFTAQEAAEKEAWEEAGIEGEVGSAMLGKYRYRKWGAPCTVQVYPMKVTRLAPEHEWLESHRGRVWMSPQRAARKLKQKELRLLVKTLVKQL